MARGHQPVPGHLVVHAVELLGQPHQEEPDGDPGEQQDRHPQDAVVQAGGYLPHLGVDEEERDEEQQERQCARHQREKSRPSDEKVRANAPPEPSAGRAGAVEARRPRGDDHRATAPPPERR